MLETLISSQTRIKLLLKFFLDSSTTAHLRALESDFGDSTNGIRLELNRLEEAGMLISQNVGNKKVFQANISHPLFNEIHNLVRKHMGLDHIVEQVVQRLGNLERVYLTGAFAKGLDSQIVEMVFLGDIDEPFLVRLLEKTELLINRKIHFRIFKPADPSSAFISDQRGESAFLLWEKEAGGAGDGFFDARG